RTIMLSSCTGHRTEVIDATSDEAVPRFAVPLVDVAPSAVRRCKSARFRAMLIAIVCGRLPGGVWYGLISTRGGLSCWSCRRAARSVMGRDNNATFRNIHPGRGRAGGGGNSGGRRPGGTGGRQGERGPQRAQQPPAPDPHRERSVGSASRRGRSG